MKMKRGKSDIENSMAWLILKKSQRRNAQGNTEVLGEEEKRGSFERCR